MASYQCKYMPSIPAHALCHSMVELAKASVHSRFIPFFNALLRRLPEADLGTEDMCWADRFSVPPFYVDRLCTAFGRTKALSILEQVNQPPQTMARMREAHQRETLANFPHAMVAVSAKSLQADSQDPRLYIQNITPVDLMHRLAKGKQAPKHLLDLCASPGGKLLLAAELFPQAKLYANDLSPHKLRRLHENCTKYALDVELRHGPGQDYPHRSDGFDLILLDVPCSNTGVFHKRPEARWRLSEEQVAQLAELQRTLLGHAAELLSPEGEIWLMTCSILPEENETLVAWAEAELPLKRRGESLLHLPTSEGWDGGFGCALKRRD
jgi:16S rRNA (cytosine967-C5)-methyltransferase